MVNWRSVQALDPPILGMTQQASNDVPATGATHEVPPITSSLLPAGPAAREL